MTLAEVIDTIEGLSVKCGYRTIVRQDVRRLNDTPDARYPVLAWQQGRHAVSADGETMRVTLVLFHIDRLSDGKANELDIQSAGVSSLNNLITAMSDHGLSVEGMVSLNTFTYRFADECAGVWGEVGIIVPASTSCARLYGREDYNDDFNDDFS